MEIRTNPLNLVGKLQDYSWRGLLAHLSAMLSGAEYWNKPKDREKNNHTLQWGFLDYLLPSKLIIQLIILIQQNNKAAKFFHTFGLPIIMVLQFLQSSFEFLQAVITSTITNSLSWPLGIASLFINLKVGDKKPEGLLPKHKLELDHTSTMSSPNVAKIFRNPLELIIEMNVKGFRSTGLLRASFFRRLHQSEYLIYSITSVPHLLVFKILDLLDSNAVTRFLSLLLFPLRMLLTVLGYGLKFIDHMACLSLSLVALPIISLVHACTIPSYKSLKKDLNTLEVNELNTEINEEEKETTVQDLANEKIPSSHSSYKALLSDKLLGNVQLESDDNHHFLVGESDHEDEVKKYRIELTKKNSPIVLKALHNNAFRWASDLHEAEQLDDTVNALNELIASPAA